MDAAELNAAAPTRNLLIVQHAGSQDPSDWITVKNLVDTRASDIEVRIANNRHPNSVTARWQARRPSLVFSPRALIDFRPRGGAVFAGCNIGKDEQLKRLTSIGLATPRTATLSPETTFAPVEWGDFVIVKPNNLGQGIGVKLVSTIDLITRYHELVSTADDSFLVQPFIDHSEDGFPTEYRVLTMFGRALYCARNRWALKRPELQEIAANPLGIIASNNKEMGGRIRSVCNDTDIITLGERAHKAFPECAVLGVDIIRDTKSGTLYVLEVNPRGDVWHLSSALAKNFVTQKHVRDLYAQFDALTLCANLLIEKTRLAAC